MPSLCELLRPRKTLATDSVNTTAAVITTARGCSALLGFCGLHKKGAGYSAGVPPVALVCGLPWESGRAPWMKSRHPAHPALRWYLVRRSRTCCLRLGMVASASTMVQAACRAACVAGVNSTCRGGEKRLAQRTASHPAPPGTVNCHPPRGNPLSSS